MHFQPLYTSERSCTILSSIGSSPIKFLKIKVFNLMDTKEVSSEDESKERIFQIMIQSMDELIVRSLIVLFLGKVMKSPNAFAEKKSLKKFHIDDSIRMLLKLMVRFLEPISVKLGVIRGNNLPFLANKSAWSFKKTPVCALTLKNFIQISSVE
jgi:hypothetical protein